MLAQIVAQVLLVEAALRAADGIALHRPEPAAVGGEDFVDEDDCAVGVIHTTGVVGVGGTIAVIDVVGVGGATGLMGLLEGEFKLGVGDDDAAFEGEGVGLARCFSINLGEGGERKTRYGINRNVRKCGLKSVS